MAMVTPPWLICGYNSKTLGNISLEHLRSSKGKAQQILLGCLISMRGKVFPVRRFA